jgi:hypothetical protein
MVRWTFPSPLPNDVACCPTYMFDELDHPDASTFVTRGEVCDLKLTQPLSCPLDRIGS